MKVGDLKIGMIITPSINKYTKLKPVFHLKQRAFSDGEETYYKNVVDVSHYHRFQKDRSCFYDYGIYMGYKYSNLYLDGVKKHHMLLVGETLACLTGYEFRYIEEVAEEN